MPHDRLRVGFSTRLTFRGKGLAKLRRLVNERA